ncbi:MAG: portal protein, partial [Actinomycetota bacterium]|nr:portal protein [Actinomycetota bacterium]
LTRFASGLHNMLVPSTIPWFIISTQNREASKDRDISLWLEQAQLSIQDNFNRPSTNFHPAIHEYMQDLGAFGTGVMMILDRPGEGPYYLTIPLYDCYLAINDLGRVDTLYRLYEHTAKELLDAFGSEPLPESVLNALEKESLIQKYGPIIRLAVDETRSQARNREIAQKRLLTKVVSALQSPKKRVATKPSRSAKARRVSSKKRRGELKKLRRTPKMEG